MNINHDYGQRTEINSKFTWTASRNDRRHIQYHQCKLKAVESQRTSGANTANLAKNLMLLLQKINRHCYKF